MYRWIAVAGFLGAGCATATLEPDDETGSPDAQTALPAPVDAGVVRSDAPPAPPPDASLPPPPPPDASLPPPPAPDASIGGIFCEDSGDCGAGTCCLLNLCVPGSEPLPGLCLPESS